MTTSGDTGVTTTTGIGGTVTEATTEAEGTSSETSSSGSSSTSTGDESSSTGDESSSTGGESSSTGDETTGSPIDCDALPVGPLSYTIRPGPKASEDLAFDDMGNMIGVQQGNLFKSTYEGVSQLWIPGAGGFVAGLRITSKGVLVFADNNTMSLQRVSPGNNFKETVLGGLEYANGLEVDLDGFVYVAEQSGGRVRRVNPADGTFDVLAEGLGSPNGLSFSPDYKRLYVGSFGGGTITAIDFKEDGETVENVGVFMAGVGGGALDGMAVDACGNIYVCEFGPAIIWKMTPDGLSLTPLVDFVETSWIPNMQWGSGIGGWDPMTMYVLDFSQTHVFEVQMGVGDKPRAYP